MADERRWHLVGYDIREPARWRRAYRLLLGYGQPVQYSLFRVRANRLQIEHMRWELERVLAPEDALLVVPLCPGCAGRIQARNREGAWPDEDPPFRIVGEESEQ